MPEMFDFLNYIIDRAEMLSVARSVPVILEVFYDFIVFKNTKCFQTSCYTLFYKAMKKFR